jgi:alpha-L-rhamnosidase
MKPLRTISFTGLVSSCSCLSVVVLSLSCLFPASSVAAGSPAALGSGAWEAHWIWRKQKDYSPYNQTVIARKGFRLDQPERAVLRITADSFYRLFINGRWVNDGPFRSWPEHFQYDVIDATPYLFQGENEIVVMARYYGVGDFHRVPKQAGLLAQLDVQRRNGKVTRVVTDSSWQVALAEAWISRTPKVSIQMEPCELYDARLEDKLEFRRAAVLFRAEEGPWRGLHPNDSAFLTRQAFALKSFLGAKLVRADGWDFCLPAARLVHPGLIEANHNTSLACGMATILNATQACAVNIQTDGMRVTIDGQGAALYGSQRVHLGKPPPGWP